MFFEEEDDLRKTNVYFRKTKQGKLKRVTREVYLHQSVACGLMQCADCNAATRAKIDLDERPVLVLDPDLMLQQTDFVLNDPSVDNCIIFNSSLSQVRNENPHTYARIRAVCRSEFQTEHLEDSTANRRFFVFCDDFFKPTHLDRECEEPTKEWERRRLVTSCKWFLRHVQQVVDDGNQTRDEGAEACFSWLPPAIATKRMILITAMEKQKALANAEEVPAMTAWDWASALASRYPDAGEKLKEMAEELCDDVAAPTDGNELKKRILRKAPLFSSHLSDAEMRQGILKGTLFEGFIRMFPNTCFEAALDIKVQTCVVEARVVGLLRLNRAIDGDLVCIRILQEELEETAALIEDEDETVDTVTEATQATAQPENLAASDILKAAKDGKTLAAEVVGILRRETRPYSGSLKPLDALRDDGVLYSRKERIFVPADPRIPHLAIRTRQSAELEGKRLVCVVDSWDRFSRRPSGHWVEVLGHASDRETESKVILREHDVVTRDFGDSVLRCLPPLRPGEKWSVPDEEVKLRLDLRKELVVSIDPPGCKDIDDAISAVQLGNGNFRVGVHIADVTHFVVPDTPLDKEAAERCTTVYLVERRTDMLPEILTTDICSLRSGVDRLSFSVIWEITPSAEIVTTEFAKSIICSAEAYTYKKAQDSIDDKNDVSEKASMLRHLLGLSLTLRKRRFAHGALELESSEIRFDLNRGMPEPQEALQTNKLVEEFMLLANQSVAEFIVNSYPDTAVLRRHPTPKMDRLKALAEKLNEKGIEAFRYADSFELSASLKECGRPEDTSTGDDYFNRLVRILTTRCMNQAVYFCASDTDAAGFMHYGLAASLYTHFTSPIRRYADILVHRLVAAALGVAPLPSIFFDRENSRRQCDAMNLRHRNAQWASTASANMYLFWFHRETGPVRDWGIVTDLRKNGCLVHLRALGIEGFIRTEDDGYILETVEGIGLMLRSPKRKIQTFDDVEIVVEAKGVNFRYKLALRLLERDDRDKEKPPPPVGEILEKKRKLQETPK